MIFCHGSGLICPLKIYLRGNCSSDIVEILKNRVFFPGTVAKIRGESLFIKYNFQPINKEYSLYIPGMKNPLYNNKHLTEYFIYGAIATVLYTVFLVLFLENRKYENFYYLFIGNFLFTGVLGYYTYTLINRPFEGKRSASMLIAGHLALTAGIILSVIMVLICGVIYFPAMFSAEAPGRLLPGAHSSLGIIHPSELILMLAANVILVSGASASFLIVIFSYAAKRNQVKDKPVTLEPQVIKQ